MPTEGKEAGAPRAGTLLDAQVPTCSPDESVSALQGRLQSSSDFCVVLNPARIVLGLIQPSDIKAISKLKAAEVMQIAPKTVRPSVPLQSLIESLRSSKKDLALVTNPEGKLMGVVRLQVLEQHPLVKTIQNVGAS
ncbi:MAG: CBS domain-containing protein [Acidobacteria bacterium]|nr:CBS domain-containing protein [Acidobacteriota bacterium]